MKRRGPGIEEPDRRKANGSFAPQCRGKGRDTCPEPERDRKSPAPTTHNCYCSSPRVGRFQKAGEPQGARLAGSRPAGAPSLPLCALITEGEADGKALGVVGCVPLCPCPPECPHACTAHLRQGRAFSTQEMHTPPTPTAEVTGARATAGHAHASSCRQQGRGRPRGDATRPCLWRRRCTAVL